MMQFPNTVSFACCGSGCSIPRARLFSRLRVLVNAGLVGAFLTGCGNADTPSAKLGDKNALAMHTAASQPASPVTVAIARTSSWPQRITADAELISLTSPTISAQVSGNVEQIFVIPGQEVKAGQLLASLHTGDLSLSTLEAQAQLAQLMTQLAEKERTLARNRDLLVRGFISQAALETVQADVAATLQQVRAAKARAELAGRNLAKAQITAPYDAVIAALHVAPGTYVRPGDSLLDLWSPKASSVRIRIPQQYAGMVLPGQPVALYWNGKELHTSVLHVRPGIDAASRSFEAHAQVPSTLRSVTGVALTATIAVGNETILSVPAPAVQLSGASAFVYLAAQESHAQKRLVKTGRQQDGYIEVLEGIQAGDAVIVEGASFVRDGHPIQVHDGRPRVPGQHKLTKQHAATTTAMASP